MILRKVGYGILSTEPYRESGSLSRLRCVITPKDNDLQPTALRLLQSDDQYRADPAGPAIVTHHHGCCATGQIRSNCPDL